MDAKATENMLIVQGLLDYAEDPQRAVGDKQLKEQLLSLIRTDRVETPSFQETLDEFLEALLQGPHAGAVREVLRELPGRPESLRGVNSSAEPEWIVDSNELRAVSAGLERELSLQAERLDVDYGVLPVFYATDRAPTGRSEPERYFSGIRGGLQFGYAEVSIPDRHRRGRLEEPPWYLPLVKKRPQKHVAMLGITEFSEGEFADHLIAAGSAGTQNSLMFIHGYNVSFEAAIRRTAQLCYDLQFDGIPILYSWPSVGRWFRYTVDEANVGSTVAGFRQSMNLIRSCLHAGTVHLMAHSMGNRLLRDYVEQADRDAEQRAAILGEIVMAAPDVDAKVFRDTRSAAWATADTFTLYASSRDWPLRLSKFIHGYDRAGDSGERLVLVDGVDTIDASGVEAGLFGHSYYGDAPSILTDVFLLLHHRFAPSDRPGLMLRQRHDGTYWEFRP